MDLASTFRRNNQVCQSIVCMYVYGGGGEWVGGVRACVCVLNLVAHSFILLYF